MNISIKDFLEEFFDHKEHIKLVAVYSCGLVDEKEDIIYGPDRAEFFLRYGSDEDKHKKVLWLERDVNCIIIYVE